MKKILLLTCLIILIPFLIVTIFVKDEEIKFQFVSNLTVRVKRVDKNKIEEVALEDYIVGVLSGEMPIEFNKEALKAQAVAARSYVLKEIEYNKNRDYDVVDTTTNQVYLDPEYLKKAWGNKYVTNINKVKTAVLETYNEYLSYDNKIVHAMYFSTSVGLTENSEEVFSNSVPYLRSVSSTWDTISPAYKVNYSFDLKDFYTKLGLPYKDKLSLSVVDTTSTGRIKKIKINGKEFPASQVTSSLKLKSTYFTISQVGEKINIITKGYGHGVGMSQYGAQGMALEGYTYDKILKHYYQGAEIKKI